MSLAPRCLLVVSLLCATGCGGIRHMMGEDEYLRQQLYDYAYDVPLDTVWEAGKQMAESVHSESRSEDGVRTAVVSIRRVVWRDETAIQVLYMRGWEEAGRSYVKFLSGGHGPSMQPHDIELREVTAELDLLTRFAPEDAAKFREGARRAGQRAR
ncbi:MULTISPECIES: hypothetical protein [Myxococcus]|uniref:hypothetical protein n=1 Tax=Myxococcus TaxID=32 RepID=UPI0013D8C59E|nr:MULTISPECIES: hypothetical protein [Myxococcus]NVJ19634.1 hypothetical protein [Myxococcus sp. AM011]